MDLAETILTAWRTNCRTTAFLIERIPDEVWNAAVLDIPRRTVRTIAVHLHNARARWIKTLGREHGIPVPALLDLRRASRRQLLAALPRSDAGIEALLRLGLDSGGAVPPSRAYVWRNLPLDVGHVLTYFVAHEAHHRGQIVMIARQLGHRLPAVVVNGLWLWTKRSKEDTGGPRSRKR